MTATVTTDRGRVARRPARGVAGTAGLLTPGVLLLVVCAVLPLIAIVVSGFARDTGGFTTLNFSRALGSPTYVSLLLRTLLTAVAVTVLSIALGWPAAWALARYVRPRTRSLVLGLVVIPYITSQLLLMYGFMTLIQAGGPLSALLTVFGADPQASFLYTPAATLVMLVYESIPTAVLVMYSASERVDPALLEAARTLGAGRLRTFGTVIWPLSSGMLLVNFSLTFVQTVGAFAEPQVLGGPDGGLLGTAISEQLNTGSGQSFAIALSLLLLVVSLAVVGVVALLLRIGSGRRRARPAIAVAAVAAATVSPSLDTALLEGRR
jgi:ABC-type spermidine/putrescine transport system permease subunit I